MNPIELKVARMRRNITGKEAAKALGLTIDGYFKKEHGTAKITLSEAYILTKLYQLTLTEFVNIFFNGDLPFLQDRTDNCNFSDAAYPLKEARLRAGYTEEAAARELNIPTSAYKQREKGRVKISLEQCFTLSRFYRLSLQEFNDIFFRSGLPFRNSDLVPYKYIIPQKGVGINAEASNNSSL